MLDFMTSGMTIFACCIIIANLKILILSYTVSLGLIIFISFSIVLIYIVYALAEKYLPYGQMHNILYLQVHSYSYWLSIVACVGLLLIFEAIPKHYNLLKDL